MASFHVTKLAILVVLLVSLTAPTLGTKVYMIEEEGVEPKVMRMGNNIKGTLSCVDAGWYCNVVFGPQCCTGTCLAVGPLGGVCIAAS